jgi:hypothetical protein
MECSPHRRYIYIGISGLYIEIYIRENKDIYIREEIRGELKRDI